MNLLSYCFFKPKECAYNDDNLGRRMDIFFRILNKTLDEVKRMSIEMDNLKTAVQNNTAAVAVATNKIKELIDKIAATNPEDAAAIQAAADEINSSTSALNTAVGV